MKLRLLPIVLFAAVSLLALKALDMFGKHGSLSAGPGTAAASETQTPAPTAPPPGAADVTTTRPQERQGPIVPTTSSEAALNERLAERRRQLEDRARELDQREALLRAAEQRLEERVKELKALEQRVDQAVQAKQDEKNAQLKGLVTMYENMKPKDAARIFDKLDLEVLIELVTRINPRKMSEILAEMQSEPAQRLTIELARRNGATVSPRPTQVGTPPVNGRELPRIDQRRPG